MSVIFFLSLLIYPWSCSVPQRVDLDFINMPLPSLVSPWVLPRRSTSRTQEGGRKVGLGSLSLTTVNTGRLHLLFHEPEDAPWDYNFVYCHFVNLSTNYSIWVCHLCPAMILADSDGSLNKGADCGVRERWVYSRDIWKELVTSIQLIYTII